MVEQRPFKALVLGSSPSQPTSIFFLLRSVFIGENEHPVLVRRAVSKRKETQEPALYLTTNVNEGPSRLAWTAAEMPETINQASGQPPRVVPIRESRREDGV